MDLFILDKNFEVVALIDVYKSLIWTERYNEAGDFELYLPMKSGLFQYIKLDYYAWIRESERYMIIDKIAVDSDPEDGDYLTVSGHSLESILNRRVVNGETEVSGNLQQRIKALLEQNFISPTDNARKIDNFLFQESTNPKVTSVEVNAKYESENIYEIVKAQCQENNVGFRIDLNSNKQFVFSMYAGEDRSYAQTTNPYVVFSPKFDNMANANYYASREDYKNVAFVIGECEAFPHEAFATVGNASGLDRRELTVDAKDIDTSEGTTITISEYRALLQVRGKEGLVEHKEKRAFEGEVETTDPFCYGVDFFVGDIVQMEDEYGNSGSAYISEMVFSHSDEGYMVYPTFKMIEDEEV